MRRVLLQKTQGCYHQSQPQKPNSQDEAAVDNPRVSDSLSSQVSFIL